MTRQATLLKWVPGIFVLLWATGFIGAKYGLPYAEPFTLLSIRMYLTLAVFLTLAGIFRARWPDRRGMLHSLLVGTLVHAAYLGGVFSAIGAGMSAGLVALLVGLQPILTAVLVWGWLGHSLRLLQAFGLLLGLLGVGLVLLPEDGATQNLAYGLSALPAALIALFGISLGTLYQKRFCQGIPLLTGTFVQYLAATLLLTLLAFAFETRQVDHAIRLDGDRRWDASGDCCGAQKVADWPQGLFRLPRCFFDDLGIQSKAGELDKVRFVCSGQIDFAHVPGANHRASLC